jgi:hypothetical protein
MLRSCFAIAIGVLIVVGTGDPAGAQALFTRPDTTPNYSAYQHVDECMAAVNRVASQISLKEPIWRDTAEFDPALEVAPLPKAARDIGRQCLAKVSVDTLPLKEPELWIPALLMADRDADVERWYTRLLDSVPAQSRLQSYNAILSAFITVRPIRMNMIKPLYTQALREVSSDSVMAAISLRLTMINLVYYSNDTILNRQLFHEIDSLVNHIPDEVKTRPEYPFMFMMLYRALQMNRKQQGFDSLWSSTEAYVAHRKELWTRIATAPYDLSGEAIGLPAPRLTGDFWFSAKMPSDINSKESTTQPYTKVDSSVRPVPRKVNMIVFFQGGCHSFTPKIPFGRSNGSSICWPTVAAIHRLKRAYPDLQITIVSKTFGSLGNAPPLSPTEEADTLAKYFLGFYRLPATLIVATTDYYRLPGLDQRRIDQASQNEVNYTFRGKMNSAHGTILVTDLDGKVVYVDAIHGESERHLKQMLDIVYKRSERAQSSSH